MKGFYLITAVIVYACSAGNIENHWAICPEEINIQSCSGRDEISIQGGMSVFENGYPNLPGVSRCYIIPPGATITSVEVSNVQTISLGYSFNPSPVRFFPLNSPDLLTRDFTDLTFPNLGTTFPSSPIAGFRTGSKTGYRLGSYSFVPFIYSESNGELQLITSADIRMVFEEDPDIPTYCLTENQLELARTGLEFFVDNPEMLLSSSPNSREDLITDVEVLIVGYESHSEQLDELKALHETMGYLTEVVTYEWLNINIDGYDPQEKIRNYLQYLYTSRGLTYAVVCGDWGETTRLSMIGDIGDGEPMMRTADLYFSDLDGNWDADGDHLFGELNDSIDGYSDIYVGRYPTREIELSSLSIMVNKAIQYNTLPVQGDWQNRILHIGAVLFPQYEGNDWRYGSKHCDSLATLFDESWNVTTHYEDTTGAHPTNTVEVFNQGFALVEIVAHGFMTGTLWYYEPIVLIFNPGINNMDNGPMLPWIHASVSCSTGQLYDPEYTVQEGFAEKLVQKADGGSIISVASSATAWGHIYEPGPAGWLAIHFSDILFNQAEEPTAGFVHGIAKDMLLADASTFFLYWINLWAVQSLNLYGDPCTHFVTTLAEVEEPSGESFHVALSQNPVQNRASVNIVVPSLSSATLELYDMSGRTVVESSSHALSPGENTIQLDTSSLSAGVYLLRATADSNEYTKKFLVIR